MSTLTTESGVTLTQANGGLVAAAIGGGLIGWISTYIYYTNKKIKAEKDANIPPDQQTKLQWWSYLLLIIGIILLLGSFGGVYYKKK